MDRSVEPCITCDGRWNWPTGQEVYISKVSHRNIPVVLSVPPTINVGLFVGLCRYDGSCGSVHWFGWNCKFRWLVCLHSNWIDKFCTLLVSLQLACTLPLLITNIIPQWNAAHAIKNSRSWNRKIERILPLIFFGLVGFIFPRKWEKNCSWSFLRSCCRGACYLLIKLQ
jgi:hypothetical protein